MSALFGTGPYTALLRSHVLPLIAGGPPYDLEIFDGAVYNPNNWASALDWSGVNWNSSKAGTLITPQVVLSASHFGAIPNPLVFTAPDGSTYSRTVANQMNVDIPGGSDSDVRLTKLNEPLPSEINVYPLPDPSEIYNDMRGGLAVYTEQNKRSYVGCIRPRIDEFFDLDEDNSIDTSLWKNVGGTFPLVGGDSGSPAFLIGQQSQMILACSWWLADASCVYLGEQGIQDAIAAGIAAMGCPDTISTLGIDEIPPAPTPAEPFGQICYVSQPSL